MDFYDDYYSDSRQGSTGGCGFPQLQFMPAATGTQQQTGMGQMGQMSPMGPMGQMQQNPLPSFPTGVPGGGIVGQMPIPDLGTPQNPTDNVNFVAGFLRTQIGKNMRVEFLVGTNGPLVDRLGTLVSVGTSYILIRPYNSREVIMCDLYSIRFVTVFPDVVATPQPY